MATTKEIRAAWAEKWEKVKHYDPKSSVQVRVAPEELEAILAEGVPEGLERLADLLPKPDGPKRPKPTHVLLWREELQLLLEHEPKRQSQSKGQPADVAGRAKAHVDDKT